MSSQLQGKPSPTSPMASIPGYRPNEPANSAWNRQILSYRSSNVPYTIQESQYGPSPPKSSSSSKVSAARPSSLPGSTNPAVEQAFLQSFAGNPAAYSDKNSETYISNLFGQGVLTDADYNTLNNLVSKYNSDVSTKNAKAQSDYQQALKSTANQIFSDAKSKGASSVHIYDESGKVLDTIPTKDIPDVLPLALQTYGNQKVSAGFVSTVNNTSIDTAKLNDTISKTISGAKASGAQYIQIFDANNKVIDTIPTKDADRVLSLAANTQLQQGKQISIGYSSTNQPIAKFSGPTLGSNPKALAAFNDPFSTFVRTLNIGGINTANTFIGLGNYFLSGGKTSLPAEHEASLDVASQALSSLISGKAPDLKAIGKTIQENPYGVLGMALPTIELSILPVGEIGAASKYGANVIRAVATKVPLKYAQTIPAYNFIKANLGTEISTKIFASDLAETNTAKLSSQISKINDFLGGMGKPETEALKTTPIEFLKGESAETIQSVSKASRGMEAFQNSLKGQIQQRKEAISAIQSFAEKNPGKVMGIKTTPVIEDIVKFGPNTFGAFLNDEKSTIAGAIINFGKKQSGTLTLVSKAPPEIKTPLNYELMAGVRGVIRQGLIKYAKSDDLMGLGKVVQEKPSKFPKVSNPSNFEYEFSTFFNKITGARPSGQLKIVSYEENPFGVGFTFGHDIKNININAGTELKGSFTPENLADTISHETLHNVLQGIIGDKASVNLDILSKPFASNELLNLGIEPITLTPEYPIASSENEFAKNVESSIEKDKSLEGKTFEGQTFPSWKTVAGLEGPQRSEKIQSDIAKFLEGKQEEFEITNPKNAGEPQAILGIGKGVSPETEKFIKAMVPNPFAYAVGKEVTFESVRQMTKEAPGLLSKELLGLTEPNLVKTASTGDIIFAKTPIKNVVKDIGRLKEPLKQFQDLSGSKSVKYQNIERKSGFNYLASRFESAGETIMSPKLAKAFKTKSYTKGEFAITSEKAGAGNIGRANKLARETQASKDKAIVKQVFEEKDLLKPLTKEEKQAMIRETGRRYAERERSLVRETPKNILEMTAKATIAQRKSSQSRFTTETEFVRFPPNTLPPMMKSTITKSEKERISVKPNAKLREIENLKMLNLSKNIYKERISDKIINKTQQKIDTRDILGRSSKITPINMGRQITKQMEKLGQPQKQKQSEIFPNPTPGKQTPEIPPPNKKRYPFAFPFLPNPSQGPGSGGASKGARQTFVGNVPEFDFTGMYNRIETIYGNPRAPTRIIGVTGKPIKQGKPMKANEYVFEPKENKSEKKSGKNLSNRFTKLI